MVAKVDDKSNRLFRCWGKNIKTPYTDFKPKIKQIITKTSQQLWDGNPHNKLFQI